MSRGGGVGGTVVGVVAVLACCALPALIVLGAGFLGAAGGLAARYWPLTVLSLAAAAWGGLRLVRLVRQRSRTLRGSGGPRG